MSWLFGPVGKRLDKKVKLNLKNMTSQTCKKVIAIHLLINVSIANVNPPMEFGQSIEYNVRNILLRKSCRKEAGTLVSELFCFKKTSCKVKTSGVNTLLLINFGRHPRGHTIKINWVTFQTVDPEISSILIFHKRVWD